MGVSVWTQLFKFENFGCLPECVCNTPVVLLLETNSYFTFQRSCDRGLNGIFANMPKPFLFVYDGFIRTSISNFAIVFYDQSCICKRCKMVVGGTAKFALGYFF